jgi:hypothetical protein
LDAKKTRQVRKKKKLCWQRTVNGKPRLKDVRVVVEREVGVWRVKKWRVQGGE